MPSSNGGSSSSVNGGPVVVSTTTTNHKNNRLSTPPPFLRGPQVHATALDNEEGIDVDYEYDVDATPHRSNTTKNTTTRSNNNNNTSNTSQQTNNNPPEHEQQTKKKSALYKSTRLKGYITLILASVINYSAARRSGRAVNSNAVASSDRQQVYAEAVSLISFSLSLIAFLAHLDRWSPLQTLWQRLFGDGSVGELLLLVFLVIWWVTATCIGTTVRGIAGDGKGQYNLYYSTWGCCWTSLWTLERWLVAYGWASFKAFISSWPFRAPGWIAILVTSFWTLMWYLDLYSNHESAAQYTGLREHYQDVPDGQWQWLVFVGCISLVPSLVFIMVELFRETGTSNDNSATTNNNSSSTRRNNNNNEGIQRHLSFAVPRSPNTSGHNVNNYNVNTNSPPSPSSRRQSRVPIPSRQNAMPDKTRRNGGKGPLENILEGFCLVVLVLAWIPTVIVATTPGGAASLVGNAYFFTWINTVFVMETFIWFVHDLRKGVHNALQQKEREYQRKQQEVLQKSRRILETSKRQQQAQQQQQQQEDDLSLLDDHNYTTPTARRNHHHRPNNNNNNSNRLRWDPAFDFTENEEEDDDDDIVDGNAAAAAAANNDVGVSSSELETTVTNILNEEEEAEIARALEEDMQRPDLMNPPEEEEEPVSPLAANNNINNNNRHLSPAGSSIFYEAMQAHDDDDDDDDVNAA